MPDVNEDMNDGRAEPPNPGAETVEEGRALTARPERKAELVASDGNMPGYIAPRNMEEAYRYAVAVCRAGLAPSSYDNDPQKVMLGIAAALEARLPPLYGLRNIAIINNRPTIWGDAATALIQNSGLLSSYKEREIGPEFDKSTELSQWPDDFGVEVIMGRKGQTELYVGRFTVGDARRAKLWLNHRKAPWMEHPLVMLTARAGAKSKRAGFADCLAGLAIREEVEDMHVEESRVVDASFLDDDAPRLTSQPTTPADAVEVTDDAATETKQPELEL